MLDPKTLCRSHLLGEHAEIHKHRHNFMKRHSVAGRRGQIEPRSMKTRHDALADEMLKRGYKHKTPYTMPDLTYLPSADRDGVVDVEQSKADLHSRCVDCRLRWEEQ